MLNQLPPGARWALAAGLVLLAVLGIYLNTRTNEVRLPDTGVIFEGVVTYDGKPLPYAVVTLYPDEQPNPPGSIFSNGSLERDGSCRIESAPLGKVKISVNTAEIRGRMMGEFVAAANLKQQGKIVETPNIIDVPPHYFSPDSSGIKETLVKGVNKVKIELKSKAAEKS
jgi:hypothetical protein